MHDLISLILPLIKTTQTVTMTFSKIDGQSDYQFTLGLTGTVVEPPRTAPDENDEEEEENVYLDGEPYTHHQVVN